MIRVREMDIEFYRHYADALASARPPAWRYDESKPCGVNYNSFFLARLYDARHEMFRDYPKETEQIVTKLGLGPSATVIDMGCGTGAFAIHAAGHCGKIHAVDVSGAMLRRARHKARRAGVANIEFHRGGFLTYEHADEPADAAVCVTVLHHLPDFWKLVGLHRLASMLKPNGRFYLFDVVFSFDVAQHEPCIKRFLNVMGMRMGLDGRAETEIHLREEYSTCDWIMAGLLERAGFRIDEVTCPDDFLAGYLCTRRSETVR